MVGEEGQTAESVWKRFMKELEPPAPNEEDSTSPDRG
jgi:hypothetical protein